MNKKIIIVALIAVIAGVAGSWYFFRPREAKDLSFNYDPGDYFVTDVKSGNRLLKSDIIIHASDSTLNKEFTENNFKIRNIIIFILREKTMDQIQSATIQQQLNDEIIAALNKEFKTNTFQKLYFNEFVMQ